ncbi:MAG: helicase [Leptolyngbya foveolarum]|uniref:Helicase n=1 Tax=Leptolyngbya foveolarum TaxID=47253 RepID=A0A2W4UGD7_9CYAN|nr:MAG: helicase [Leptolyngbya foveolarum]
MPSSKQTDQQILRQAYDQLSEIQKSVVQVFAVLCEPTSREQARRCWIEAMLQQPERDRPELLNSKQFGDIVTQLIKQRGLTQQRGEGPTCANELREIAIREAVLTDRFEPIAQAVEAQFPVSLFYRSDRRNFRHPSEFVRSLRIAIYRQDALEIDRLFEEVGNVHWKLNFDFLDVLRHILNHPFDADWMRGLSADFLYMGLNAILEDSVVQCVPADEAFELLEETCEEKEISPDFALLYAEQLWLRGYVDEAREVLMTVDASELAEDKELYWALMGAIAFLTGETQAAIAHYRLGLKAAGNLTTEQADWFNHAAAMFFFFALLEDSSLAALQEAEKYIVLIKGLPFHWIQSGMLALHTVLQMQQGKMSAVINATQRFQIPALSTIGLPALIEMYSLHWLGVEGLADWLPEELAERCQAALQAGYGWIALEIAELLVSYQPESVYVEIVEGLREQTDSLPLIDVVERKAAWELSLSALTNLSEPSAMTAAPAAEYRLIWRLRFRGIHNWSLLPLEQKISVKGGWTKGRAIALKRLYANSDIPNYATPQDRTICDTIEAEYEQSSRYYGPSNLLYSFTDSSLLALIGHPLLFWEDSPNVRVDVVEGAPELLVKRLDGDRLSIELSPKVTGADLWVEQETPTRLKVISVTADHRRIAEVLGPKNRLEVPVQAEERVLQAIASVASLVTVQSDIGGGGVEAEEVPADATTRVHLLPAGSGLKVSLLTHPFPEGGSYYPPGEGGETVIAEVDGQRLQTRRDLKLEQQNARAVSEACSVLQQHEPEAGEWLIEEPSDCLELLLQLKSLEDTIEMEWPEGEKFKVSRQLGINDFKFDIRKQQDWFAASGEVQISEDQVMDLRQLMALLAAAPGQFVPLADGEFLALTDEFRQRLQTISRLSHPHGEDLRIHGLAALALDEMIDDIEQLEVDNAWKAHINHIKAAREIEPEVPKTLQATLRDYQTEGYTWLARLANWGVGACLADDMGLGKTLQGLAVVLDRSHEGPTLVIAPTSVCLNWASEAERFAPSLQVKDLGVGDRQTLINNLKPNDLLVCSYGLIQQEDVAAMLATVTWRTIVLDEAQAIKNHATKRSQAVMALQGGFKVIMTGTPIENHLGELWNLFRFINPGLLGSLDSFNLRFANPIERDKNNEASDTLRRLIRPFILRRTKDQVLKELPSRTEITLPVELSQEEMAFYEALRREALEKLNDSEAQAGQKHLQVLAEIMKLRRACCNPSLVRPELAIPSTKLEQFSELIKELLDNGHKALVFSQFVDHLKILRNHLDKQQIAYQYLDGSTPAKKRKQGVDAFQNGEGDVFLISLKAGGTGLNLTAADYVLHMDPWWNPAVEDQASDRAHRIGQQRPVTIYRLVAKGTIEDKIVALHKIKRDLADSLLTGSDASGKVSTEDLLSLMQQ